MKSPLSHSLEGYEHNTVNHSKYFNDPITGVHTNTTIGLNFHESIGKGSDRRLVIRRVTVSSAPSSPAINQPLPIEYPLPEELPVSLPKRSKRERFLSYWANDLNSSLS